MLTLMTFRGDLNRPTRNISGGGGGVKLAAGGGIGTLVLVGLFLLMGGNPADLDRILGSNQQQSGPAEVDSGDTSTFDHCQTGADANTFDDCRLWFTAASLDQVWSSQLPQQAQLKYTEPGLTLFKGATQTACGAASSATGPFYCPGDRTAYFDTSFFDQLKQLGGKDAPFAQEYIVAHEFGHHIQNIEGTLGLSDYNNPGADSAAVKVELQADCYAGIWAHYADKGQDAFLEPVSEAQVYDAVTTARAVGDDNIQQRTSGKVRPDMFTHGSSEQRQQAFLAGYTSGKMSSCDFFNRGVYN